MLCPRNIHCQYGTSFTLPNSLCRSPSHARDPPLPRTPPVVNGGPRKGSSGESKRSGLGCVPVCLPRPAPNTVSVRRREVLPLRLKPCVTGSGDTVGGCRHVVSPDGREDRGVGNRVVRCPRPRVPGPVQKKTFLVNF